MQLKREKLKVGIGKDKERQLWDKLRELYKPVVTDVTMGFRRMLELDESRLSTKGELFLTSADSLLYYWVSDDRRSLEAGSISPNGSDPALFDDFRNHISTALDAWTWLPIKEVNQKLSLVLEETEPFPMRREELEAAQILADPTTRELLMEASKRTYLSLDAFAQGDTERYESVIEQLESKGLLQREFEVYCRDTGKQLARFPDLEGLREAAARGFRSPTSNRLISEERIDQMILATPRGKWLARKNLWLALALADVLNKQGIESELFWVHERDYSIMDLFVSVSDALLMFELNEDPVGADAAYRFMTRMKYYRPDAAFIVCPQKISSNAKQLLSTSSERDDLSIYIVEDLNALAPTLETVLQTTTRIYIERILSRFTELTRIPVGRAIGEHLCGPEPEPDELPTQAEDRAETPDLADDIAPGLESGLIPPEQETGEVVDDLDIEQLLSMGEELIKEEASTEPTGETSSSTDQAQPPSEPPLTEPTESDPLADLNLDLDLDLNLNLELGDLDLSMPSSSPAETTDDILKETHLVEALPDVDIPIVEERTPEEMVASALQAACETLQGPAFDLNNIIPHLQEISDIPGYTAALSSHEGLLCYCPSPQAEIYRAAAVHTELLRAFGEALENSGDDSSLKTLLLEGGDQKLQIQLTGHPKLQLLVSQILSTGESESEAGTLPGEMELRGAITRKVLEDLNEVEEIQGNVIISTLDGLPIEFEATTELDFEAFSIHFADAVRDEVLEYALNRCLLVPLKQIVLTTQRQMYSYIPLDQETALLTFLRPNTSREIWQARLRSAAAMLTSVFQ